ncbi:MAG: cysteine methyltransferase [Candidatus Thermofonsia Clade 1 bacterium]|uniref:Cysteine methyltransferase n=1 Tax=Candidatus Thermofonsia Clade 1 bacterium TaxID=2364210 RepID=A0A2M8PZQ9_9CHLR|nr:MAG: cysteine methyltransferase [Candidatus Thermofonsia Clade 1 bacterium]
MPGFNERVYSLVRRIPRGKVLTYGRVAALLGVPRGARAVGWALHGAPSDVPWQRVVNAKGRISTRCQEHPPQLQRALLMAEGLRFKAADEFALADFPAVLWLLTPEELAELR